MTRLVALDGTGLTSWFYNATSEFRAGYNASYLYNANGMVTNSTGTWKGPFGYSGAAGYQEDETGLQLLGHRYYDPSTGRFLTRDPIKDGRNWYSYCDNNPLNCTDADGLKPGDKYKTRDEAAIAALEDAWSKQGNKNEEWGGWLYQNSDGSWSYTDPVSQGNPEFVNPGDKPKGKNGYAGYHTHANYDPKMNNKDLNWDSNELPSDRDMLDSDIDQTPEYIGTANGDIILYIPMPKNSLKGERGSIQDYLNRRRKRIKMIRKAVRKTEKINGGGMR
jgi:RHS repeat-associated protein